MLVIKNIKGQSKGMFHYNNITKITMYDINDNLTAIQL